MKKNAILFSAGNYINSPILSVPSLSGVKYDIQAINKRLTQKQVYFLYAATHKPVL